MSLESGEAVKVLEEHIEILKHNLLFLMAERKPESMMMTQINTIKRELDKAVQERMELSQRIIIVSANNLTLFSCVKVIVRDVATPDCENV